MNYVIFHGHFYQPPRESPYTEEIDIQESAYPFDNWNERIANECYIPNTFARIIDSYGYIIKIINNLEYISFNFGPTLLKWIKIYKPELYKKIIEADRESLKHFEGCGNAIAQVYNHVIMPLCDDNDKKLQVYWGIKDFYYHFKRYPKGMWLSETAVDISTLETLAYYNIKFTILGEHQIKRVKKINSNEWENNFIPRKPILVKLPSGNKIIVFPFDRELSAEVSFKDALYNGEKLANNLINKLKNLENSMILIATDGETFGHHKKFGELGLAFAINYLLNSNIVKVSNLEYYLKNNYIEYEGEIYENTSWSCFHGIERWRSDCGCRFDPNTNQKWRTPFRQSIDFLKNEFLNLVDNNIYKSKEDFFKDLLNYIDIILIRDFEVNDFNSFNNYKEFIYNYFNDKNIPTKLKLLEIYKNILFSYTSCGWFFDDISGIEATQNMKYLEYAINKMYEIFDKQTIDSIKNNFLDILEKAESNYPKFVNGKYIFLNLINSISLELLIASHILNKQFFGENTFKYNLLFYYEDLKKINEQDYRFLLTSIKVTNIKYLEEKSFIVVSALLSNMNIFIGVNLKDKVFLNFFQLFKIFKNYLNKLEIIGIINTIENYFKNIFTLKDILINIKRKVVNKIINSYIKEIDNVMENLLYSNKFIVNNLIEYKLPIPLELSLILQLIIDLELEKIIKEEALNIEKIEEIKFYINNTKIELDFEKFSNLIVDKISIKIENIINNFKEFANILTLEFDKSNKEEILINKLNNIKNNLNIIKKLIELSTNLDINLNLWKAQNKFYNLYYKIFYNFYKSNIKNPSFSSYLIKINECILELANYLKIRIINI
ncbi:MAG: DUF3536 domain-containing protein [bacterium]